MTSRTMITPTSEIRSDVLTGVLNSDDQGQVRRLDLSAWLCIVLGLINF